VEQRQLAAQEQPVQQQAVKAVAEAVEQVAASARRSARVKQESTA
jgi:hypothetical protein